MEVYRESFAADPDNFAPSHTSDVGTQVEFYYHKVAEKDYCRMVFPGNKLVVWDQPVREQDKVRFRRQYDLYKQGKDQFGGQTMMEQWSDIDEGSRQVYREMNIRTVEALAQLPDANMGNFPPGHASLAHRHRDMARNFLDEQQKASGFNEAIAAANQSQEIATAAMAENAELKAQLEAMQAQINAQAQINTMAPESPPDGEEFPIIHKRRPGGWEYKLSNGEIIVGKDAAMTAQRLLDAAETEEVA